MAVILSQQKLLLGDILIRLGYCDAAAVQKALGKAVETNRRIGTVLMEMGCISERDLVFALAEQFGAKTLYSLDDHELVENARDIVPFERALIHMVFPLDIRSHSLSLATCDPASYYFTLMISVRRPVVTAYVAPFNLVLQGIALTYKVPDMISDSRNKIFRFAGFAIPDAIKKTVMCYLLKTGNILAFEDGKFKLEKAHISKMRQGSINAAWLLGAVSIASDGSIVICGVSIPFLFDSRKVRRRVEDILRKKNCSNDILNLAFILGIDID